MNYNSNKKNIWKRILPVEKIKERLKSIVIFPDFKKTALGKKSALFKKTIVLFFVSSFFLLFLFIFINWYMVRQGEQVTPSSLKDLKKAQAAIVLGARVYSNNRVSAIMYDRLLTGAELYKQGKVSKILITGDHGQTNYDEVNTVKNWLIKMGIPENDIFTDHAGFSTYDSLYRARAIFQVKTAIIVTQQFHLPRAIYLGDQKGIDVQGYPADRRRYAGITYYNIRESLARVKDFFKIHLLHAKPKYLGKKIPITGDGRASKG